LAQASVVNREKEPPAYTGSRNDEAVTTVAMARSSGTSAMAHWV
jgi:hypothetical protein